jgi:hypothetical protein
VAPNQARSDSESDAPVYLVLAFMGYARISLDMTTPLTGGISSSGHNGVGAALSIARTRAVFFVFIAAYMVNIAWFGTLMSMAVVFAFLADITLAPALMMIATPKRRVATD